MNRICDSFKHPAAWILLAVAFLVGGKLWAANPSAPEEWDASYETNPAAGDNVSQGDDWFRELKKNIRERVEVEHQMGSGAGPPADAGDNGAHRQGSARVFVEETEPTVLDDSAELHDNTNPGAGSGTLSAAETNHPSGANAPAVGHGRLWTDPPSYGFYVYDDVDAGAATNHGFRAIFAPRGHGPNYVFNGAWNAEGIQLLDPSANSCVDTNDNDGADSTCINDPTTTETAGSANGYCDTGCAKIGPPLGWVEAGTPADYTIVDAETEAAAVQQAIGTGNYILEVSGDSNTDGLNQVLTGLQESTEYMVVAQAYSDGTNSCTIDVAGEDTTAGTFDLTGLTTTSASVVQLVGFFQTDASATDITLSLTNATAATYDCHWANIGVYATRPSNDHLRRDWIYEFTDEFSTLLTTVGPTRDLIYGGNGCVLRVDGVFGWNGTGTSEIDLQVDIEGAGLTELVNSIADANTSEASTLSFTTVITEAELDAVSATTAGDTLAFALDAGATQQFSCNAGTTNQGGCRIIVEQKCF